MASIQQTMNLGRAVLLLFGAVTWLPGCSESGGGGSGEPGPGNAALRGDVLASLGQRVTAPLQEQFASRAAGLESALADAVSDAGDRESAQAAWRAALEPWQQLEMMQFGPSGSSLSVMGGQDLRARLYTWPDLNLCFIDQQTIEDGYDDPDVLEATAGAPRGLWAIEYLLFTEDPGNNCSPLNTINQDGTWDAMADMIASRRLAYAAALSTLVRRRADELVAAWSPSGGNYLQELTNPGRSGAVYGTVQEGLNAVSDAMFYLDTDTKDMKLAQPIGITGCESTRCPEAIESQWAARSKEHVIANLVAFQALFLGASPGTEAPGYDDLLADMGAADVAEDMAAAIAGAITATEAIPGTIRDAIESDPESVEAAHAAVREITDILKSDFLSVLDLEAPARAAGDND